MLIFVFVVIIIIKIIIINKIITRFIFTSSEFTHNKKFTFPLTSLLKIDQTVVFLVLD